MDLRCLFGRALGYETCFIGNQKELAVEEQPKLAQLRRFEYFSGPKWLESLRWTPKGRHYSGVGGAGARAVILGGGQHPETTPPSIPTTLPTAPETAAMLFWALLAAGQITMRKVDGWQTL